MPELPFYTVVKELKCSWRGVLDWIHYKCCAYLSFKYIPGKDPEHIPFITTLKNTLVRRTQAPLNSSSEAAL